MTIEKKNQTLVTTIIVVTLFSLLGSLFCLDESIKRSREEKENHRLSVLKLCNDNCYPYTTRLCYFADKNNVFIACANNDKLLVKPLK